MNKNRCIAAGLLFLAIIVLAATAWGQDIKARMRSRLPAIVELKKAGVVGENNQGFLVIRKSTDQKSLVNAENQDRRTIYTAIAKKQNTTLELVGRRRAIQIAAKADPGTWIQNANGQWSQK
jgi:uncharacterized protein YdbL (DUF1318 family)